MLTSTRPPLKTPVVTAIRVRRPVVLDRHGVPAVRQREQRRDRDREHVAVDGVGDPHLHRNLVEPAGIAGTVERDRHRHPRRRSTRRSGREPLAPCARAAGASRRRSRPRCLRARLRRSSAPIWLTRPGVVCPSGSWICTRSPMCTSCRRDGSSGTLTARPVELRSSSCVPGCAGAARQRALRCDAHRTGQERDRPERQDAGLRPPLALAATPRSRRRSPNRRRR